MNERMKAQREKFLDRQKAIQDEEILLASFKPREEKLGNEIVGIRFDIETAETQNHTLFADVAKGTRTEQDLKTHGSALKGLRDDLTERETLLQTILKESKISQEKILKLQKEANFARHAFWYGVTLRELEKLKVDRKGLEPFLRCWAAMELSGAPVLLADFLKEHFQDRFQNPAMKEVKERLRKEMEV
jgi:hypothetical protein